jgi:hypothetical protein
MPILTETFEGTPEGMNVFVPSQELPDTQARYMQDILVDYPGLVRRRGPVRSVAGAVTFANKVSGIVQTLDPNGANRIGVLNGSASLGYFSTLSDFFNTKTDHPIINATPSGFPLTASPPSSPYSIVSSSQALQGGALVGLSTHYGLPTRQALFHWRGARTPTYGTGTITCNQNSKTVTGAGTGWSSANMEPGMFIFMDGTPASMVGVVKSVDSATQITLEKNAIRSASGVAYSAQPIRGISLRVAKGRITTDTASTAVTGANTKFRDWGFDNTWLLFRLSDMTLIGQPTSVQSNTGLTLTGNAAIAMSNERYVAVQWSGNMQVSTLSGNRLGFLTAVYAERQWYANLGQTFQQTSRLWFSDTQDFEAVDFSASDGDFIPVGQGRDAGQPIRALAPAYNAMLILKDSVSYALRGSGPSSFAVTKLMDDGTLSGMSVQYFAGGVIWAGKDGIYFYDGVQTDNLTQQKLGDFYKNMVRSFDPSKYRMWSMLSREHYFLFIESATPNVPVLKGQRSATPTTTCIVINMPTRAITLAQNLNMRGSIVLPADTGEAVWYVVNGYPTTLANNSGRTSTTSTTPQDLVTGTQYMQKITVAADGWTPRATMYLDGNGAAASGTCKVKMALYADSSGTPGSILAECDPVQVGAFQSAATVDFDYVIAPRVPAGTYWLGVMVEKSNFVRGYQIAGAAGQRQTISRSYTLGFPDPWPGSGAASAFDFVLYTRSAPTSTVSGYVCYANDLFDTQATDDIGCDSGTPGPDFYFESKRFSSGDSLRKKLFKQLAIYYTAQGGNIHLDTVVGLTDSGKTSTSVFPSSTPTWDSIRTTYTTWDALRLAYSTWDVLVSAVFRPKRMKFLKRSTHLAFRLYQSSALMPKLQLGPYQIGYKLQRPGRI